VSHAEFDWCHASRTIGAGATSPYLSICRSQGGPCLGDRLRPLDDHRGGSQAHGVGPRLPGLAFVLPPPADRERLVPPTCRVRQPAHHDPHHDPLGSRPPGGSGPFTTAARPVLARRRPCRGRWSPDSARRDSRALEAQPLPRCLPFPADHRHPGRRRRLLPPKRDRCRSQRERDGVPRALGSAVACPRPCDRPGGRMHRRHHRGRRRPPRGIPEQPGPANTTHCDRVPRYCRSPCRCRHLPDRAMSGLAVRLPPARPPSRGTPTPLLALRAARAAGPARLSAVLSP